MRESGRDSSFGLTKVVASLRKTSVRPQGLQWSRIFPSEGPQGRAPSWHRTKSRDTHPRMSSALMLRDCLPDTTRDSSYKAESM